MYNDTQYCPVCDSKNRLFVDDDSEAWECWSCYARFYLYDDDGLTFSSQFDLSFQPERINFAINFGDGS